ncbi:MAG: ATP-binding protein [Candidatus Microsaccharimonas sp.]
MNELNFKDIRVLLVDDDEDDYLILKRTFSQIPHQPFILTWSSDFDEAKDLVKTKDYDIFLIDYRLGAHTGLELLEIASPSKRSEPFLLLTGTNDTVIERKSIQLAAADYLVKGTLDVDSLSRALYYALGRKQFESQRLEHFIELNKTKDEFISLASHQLRTPATGVKQYLGMVIQGMAGEVPTQQLKLLEKAYESNERQLTIVSDLLRVAQVDAGKVHIRKRPVDIVDLISDVAKEQAETYSSRGQTLKVDVSNSPAIANADEAKVRMVFENLIDNASKYSDREKTVKVKIENEPQWVRVDVVDQGVGLAPEDTDKLFEKFSRVHNHLSTQVGGSGLGLYWAKNIVDLHGGMIRVVSASGSGSTFSVYLPQVSESKPINNNDKE